MHYPELIEELPRVRCGARKQPLLDELDFCIDGLVFLLGQSPRCLLLNDGHKADVVVTVQDRVCQFVHLQLEALPAVVYLLSNAVDRVLMVRYLAKANAVRRFKL